VTRWSQDLGALARKTGLRMETVVRKVTFELFRNVVLKSPVDQGRFRANWNVSLASPDPSFTDGTSIARGLTEASKALSLPVGQIVYLTNGLPYARRLEFGYSKQAPYGMVRLSLLEYRRYLLKALT
jgi:hypothetical protein